MNNFLVVTFISRDASRTIVSTNSERSYDQLKLKVETGGDFGLSAAHTDPLDLQLTSTLRL